MRQRVRQVDRLVEGVAVLRDVEAAVVEEALLVGQLVGLAQRRRRSSR